MDRAVQVLEPGSEADQSPPARCPQTGMPRIDLAIAPGLGENETCRTRSMRIEPSKLPFL